MLASDTDTEVVAHLLAEEFAVTADLAEAMRLVCRRLDGAFTLVGCTPTSRTWLSRPAELPAGGGRR